MKSATTSRRRQVLDLPVRLDKSFRNHGAQIHAALRSAIVDGRLRPGVQLPSSRSLAEQLGVSRNAVVVAYEHLASDGLLDARHGAGTYVAQLLPAPLRAKKLPELDIAPRLRPRPFALGHAFVGDAVLRRLASHFRRHVLTAGAAELGYGDPRGSEHLRVQIAQYLAANRGVRCDPGSIVIVSGTQHGIRLCAAALFKPGDTIWMEDPGYDVTQRTLRASGLNVAPVPVDEEGLDVAAGLRLGMAAEAAYVTPSHQFPTGVTMSMRRRIALIDWARSAGSWIIEDDYDSEFRYDSPPLTALAGIEQERVIYVGTFSKTLFASLRLAYLVLPPGLVERVVAGREAFDRFPPRFSQDAVADLMAEGTLSAHTRRMRAKYTEARDRVVEILRESAGDKLQVVRPAQGLHLVALLAPDVSKRTAHAVLEAAQIDARLISEMRLRPSGPEGFVLGYSGHESTELVVAAQRLGRAARFILG